MRACNRRVRFKVSGLRWLTSGIHARQDDWVMRMRFWDEITRGVSVSVRGCFGARAFRPKARSPHPITLPYRCQVSVKLQQNKPQPSSGKRYLLFKLTSMPEKCSLVNPV